MVCAACESAGWRTRLYANQFTDARDIAALSAGLSVSAFDLLSNLSEFSRQHLVTEIGLCGGDDGDGSALLSLPGSDAIGAISCCVDDCDRVCFVSSARVPGDIDSDVRMCLRFFIDLDDCCRRTQRDCNSRTGRPRVALRHFERVAGILCFSDSLHRGSFDWGDLPLLFERATGSSRSGLCGCNRIVDRTMADIFQKTCADAGTDARTGRPYHSTLRDTVLAASGVRDNLRSDYRPGDTRPGLE